MSPITLVVLALAVVAAVFLIRRETQTGGLLGLSVEQRSKLLEPLAEYILRRTLDDDVVGRIGGDRVGGTSVTVPARALSAWAHWKYGYDSGEARAWSAAIAVAREKINDEQDDFGARILEGLGAMVGAVLATIAGGPLAGVGAWGSYVGGVTLRELEADELVGTANAYMREQVQALPRIEAEFYRFLWCAPDAGDGVERRADLPDPEWWNDRQPTPENIAACARFAFADRRIRR